MDTYYFLEKVLRSLTAEEHKRFEKFLHSTYFHIEGTSMCCVCRFYKCIMEYFVPSAHGFKNFHWNIIIQKWLALIRGGGNYNDSTLRGRKLKKQISEVKSELLHYIYYFLKVEHFIKNSLEGELGLVDELNERGLTDISRHYVKSRRFVFPESLDKTECVYWEYRAWHVLNTFRKKTGLRIGDDDFIIEHGLLREYYNMMKTNISRQMMCDDKEEAFRKFGSQ